jgi:hypothetical protein
MLRPLLGLIVASGCSAAPRYARINDVSPPPLNSGYRVVAVDDGAEVRASGKVVTVVPVVLVPPGRRTFTIQSEDGTKQTFPATVEADAKYRLARQDDGTATLVKTDEEGVPQSR